VCASARCTCGEGKEEGEGGRQAEWMEVSAEGGEGLKGF
jgi:hypothetical protein